MHHYISKQANSFIICWTVETDFDHCNQAIIFLLLILLCILYNEKHVVDLNSNWIIKAIRFTTFPELRACKNIYIIGRYVILLKWSMGYVKNLQKKIKTVLNPWYACSCCLLVSKPATECHFDASKVVGFLTSCFSPYPTTAIGSGIKVGLKLTIQI